MAGVFGVLILLNLHLGELERVQAGITLLSQSVEKLEDVVNVDTRCCFGLYDALMSAVGKWITVHALFKCLAIYSVKADIWGIV
jgi:hypothetical protein